MKLIVNLLSNTILKIYDTMRIEKKFVDIDLDEVFSNPADRKELNAAIEYLKQHNEETEKEITLSDNEKLIISIS